MGHGTTWGRLTLVEEEPALAVDSARALGERPDLLRTAAASTGLR